MGIVRQVISELAPGAKVEQIGPRVILVNGRRINLDNVWRSVQRDPLLAGQIIRAHLGQLWRPVEESFPKRWSEVEAKIMPRIQPRSFFDHLDEHEAPHVKWTNDTVIVFVCDEQNRMVSLTTPQLAQWEVTLEEVKSAARCNLERSECEVKILEAPDGGRGAVIHMGDGYDSSRLLLGNLHGRLSPFLGQSFYAGIPARDMLVLFSMEPEPFVSRLHRHIAVDFTKLEYPVTPELFVVTRDGIAGTVDSPDYTGW